MRRSAVALLLLLPLSLLVLETPAAAQPGAAPPGATPIPASPAGQSRTDVVEKRYGWHIMTADGLTVATAATTGSGEVFLGGYLLGGPVIHLAHGNAGKALGSLALRAGAPIGGLYVGAAIASADCNDEGDGFCPIGGMVLGLFGGMITASVLDAAFLARKTEVVEREPATIDLGRVSARPDIGVSPRGDLSLGLSGRF